MSSKRIALGKKGEKLAVMYLRKKGYRILETNYRCRWGEIDIIAALKEVLVFVEVRARSSERCGHPLESITYNKQKKIRMLASAYLQTVDYYIPQVRFDVLVFMFSSTGEMRSMKHVKNAF